SVLSIKVADQTCLPVLLSACVASSCKSVKAFGRLVESCPRKNFFTFFLFLLINPILSIIHSFAFLSSGGKPISCTTNISIVLSFYHRFLFSVNHFSAFSSSIIGILYVLLTAENKFIQSLKHILRLRILFFSLFIYSKLTE